MKKITLIILSLILTSCATILPKITTDLDNNRCHLVTKKLTLDAIAHPMLGDHCHDTDECLFILGVSALYTITTSVISGSIVLVGNTVHWLEKQGKCDDSFINKYMNKHNRRLLNKEWAIN
jgi:hypothetical protein